MEMGSKQYVGTEVGWRFVIAASYGRHSELQAMYVV